MRKFRIMRIIIAVSSLYLSFSKHKIELYFVFTKCAATAGWATEENKNVWSIESLAGIPTLVSVGLNQNLIGEFSSL